MIRGQHGRKEAPGAARHREAVMYEPLADRLVPSIMSAMSRLRALAALFACLAVLAGALNSVLAAPIVPTATQSATSAPCDCDGCEKAPCPVPQAGCIQAQTGHGAALPAVPVGQAVRVSVAVPWSSADTTLSGLSPPPDPLPPRP